MKRMFDELGEVWHSSVYMPTVGPLSIINTINVQDVETVLRDPYTFVKGGIVSKILADFGGQGIIASDGEHWYAQRKTASQLFNGVQCFAVRALLLFLTCLFPPVANFRDVFSGEFLDEVSMLCNHLEAAAKQNAIIDIQASRRLVIPKPAN